MNPFEFLKLFRDDIIDKLIENNALADNEATEVIESVEYFIEKLSNIRLSKSKTKKILIEVNHNKFSNYIKHFLFQSLSDDDSYKHAYNILLEQYNCDNYNFELPPKIINDSEIYRLISENSIKINHDTKSKQPIVKEEYIDDLYAILKPYFNPKESFLNFLKGANFEGKINFTGTQNQLAGIFIDFRKFPYAEFGTHNQTFEFIKKTFLIKNNPIVTKQILTYLKEPGKMDRFGNITTKGKANPKNWIDLGI